MKLCSFVFLISAIAVFSGCATTFEKTGNYEAKPRAPGCDFAIYTTPPSTPFKEVGLIRFYTGVENPVHTLDGVKKAAQGYVCKAGGNGIILPEPKDLIYSQATVIFTEEDAAKPIHLSMEMKLNGKISHPNVIVEPECHTNF